MIDNFKNVKYCIGPMTLNVVNTVIEFCNVTHNKMIFIPSRRQIDFNDGYVNNWNTKEFCEYVKSKTNNIYLERDHGGPGQGTFEDNGIESFQEDCKYFDIIHIDPWKKYPDYDKGLNETIELLKYCYKLNHSLYFEVSTEESIRPFTQENLELFINDLKTLLPSEIYNQIIYIVIQSGTALNTGENIGKYNKQKLIDMVNIVNSYGFLSKEHNGDWIDESINNERFLHGLNAINIAPEFGMIETKTILEEIDKFN